MISLQAFGLFAGHRRLRSLSRRSFSFFFSLKIVSAFYSRTVSALAPIPARYNSIPDATIWRSVLTAI